MTHILSLSNGVDTLDFYDYSIIAILPGGEFGAIPSDDQPRVIKLRVWFGQAEGNGTLNETWKTINTLERMLTLSPIKRSLGRGRNLSLTIRLHDMSESTTYHVIRGELEDRPDLWNYEHIGNAIYESVTLSLMVETYGDSDPVPVLINEEIYGTNVGITHMYWNYSDGVGGTPTLWSSNIAGLVSGSLYQVNTLNMQPRIAIPSQNDALYFGISTQYLNSSNYEKFERVILGIDTACEGTYAGVWEYYTGSTWASLAILRNDFKRVADWDTVALPYGHLIFNPKANPGYTSVNLATINAGPSVTGYFIRWRMTSNTGTMTKIGTRENGPATSYFGKGYIDGDLIAGDVMSSASLHFKNFNSGLADNFEDGVRDSAKWTQTTSGTVSIAEENSTLTIKNIGTTGINYAYYESVAPPSTNPYDMRGSFVATKVTQVTNSTANAYTLFGIYTNNNTYSYEFYKVSGNLLVRRNGSTLYTQIYNDASQQFWRIEHNTITDVIYFKSSADGVTWDTIYSETRNASIDLSSVVFRLRAGTTATEANPGQASFDSFYFGGLSEIKLAASGLNDETPVPFVVEAQSASRYVPTAGDVALAVVPDSTASLGEAVEVTLVSGGNYSDAAVKSYVNLSSYCVTASSAVTTDMTAGNKLYNLWPNVASGITYVSVEVIFKTGSTVPTGVFSLVSQWDGNNGTNAKKIFWLGINAQKLRGMVGDTTNTTFSMNGSTTLQPNTWYVAAMSFRGTANEKARLYLNGTEEANMSNKNMYISNAKNLVAFNVMKAVGWNIADSSTGALTETASSTSNNIYVSAVRVIQDSVANNYGSTPYMPKSKWSPTDRTLLLWEFEENSASYTYNDTSGVGTAMPGLLRTTSNAQSATTAQVRTAGYFVSGFNSLSGKIMGLRLPRIIGEQAAGSYRVYIAAKPAVNGQGEVWTPEVGNTYDPADFALKIQFNVGDADLGFQSVARNFPTPYIPNNGYYMLDMGTVSLPPGTLNQDYGVSPDATSFLDCFIYAEHGFAKEHRLRIDCIYFIPTELFEIEYTTFRKSSSFPNNFEIHQEEGLLADSNGSELIISQTADNPIIRQKRNPYALPLSSSPKFFPRKDAFLYAIPLRGVLAKNEVLNSNYYGSPNFLVRNSVDKLIVNATVVGKWRIIAS